MTRPGSWSGTDEQLAERWSKARHTTQWIQFEPMTGWLGPATRPGIAVDDRRTVYQFFF